MTEADAVTLIDRLEEISGSIQRLADMQREQTAATVLAAMFVAHATANAHVPHHALNIPDEYLGRAVRVADALRAELSKVKP